MSNLSELDLQNLRHLITGYETCGEKMSCYAKEATDPEPAVSDCRSCMDQSGRSVENCRGRRHV